MSSWFSSKDRQQAKASRPFGLRLRRMLMNAAVGSAKNITPNREKAASNEADSNGNTSASAWTNRTRWHPSAARRANARTAADRSTPRPRRLARPHVQGPALSHPRHSLCPGRSHQKLPQTPSRRADRAERVAVPIAPAPPSTRALVFRLGSASASGCSDSCTDLCRQIVDCRCAARSRSRFRRSDGAAPSSHVSDRAAHSAGAAGPCRSHCRLACAPPYECDHGTVHHCRT